MSTRSLRVLLIAEACNPEWTSVPLEGYNLYRALREIVDVTLVTQVRNRAALLRHAAESERIEFIDSERLAAPFHRLGRLLTLGKGLGWTTKQAVDWLPYLYFEHLVYQKFRRALARGEYDIVHRITPLTPTYPSPIASWTDVPFVLGPINGGLPWPKGTTRTRFAEMEWLSYFRDAYRVLPYVRSTYERAACVIAGSKYTLSALPRRARERAVYIPENGVDPRCFHANGRTPPSRIQPFRIVFAGRLVPLKRVDMLLKAVAESRPLRDAIVTLIGDGPSREALQKTTADLGIAARVEWKRRLSQGEMGQRFRASSVFVLPSLKEFGGAVVVEAMACGLPCVVLDHGGPADHVTGETGITLPLAAPGSIVSALRRSLEDLVSNPGNLDVMSRACVARIEGHYTWGAKAVQIRELYEDVKGKRSPQASTTSAGLSRTFG